MAITYILYMDAIRMLDLVHHEGALQGAQALDRPQYIEDELLIILHVGRMDLEQVVVVAGDVVAFRHLGDLLDHIRKRVGNLPVDPLELHVAEDDEPLVELLGIQNGYVFLDVALILQPFQPFEHRRGGEADTGCELFDRQSGILLKRPEDLQVGLVQFFCFVHKNKILLRICFMLFIG